MVATIGIKVANGDFYSILEENSAVKKRLVLTTVHDNQKSVQIDLYKSFTKSMADALYIGSLVVEKISPGKKGEPSIEMTITSTADGLISADSVELGDPAKEHQNLNLHLKSFEEDTHEYPDFEMEDHTRITGDVEPEKGKFPWLVLVVIIVVLLLALLGLWYFMFRARPSSGSGQGAVSQSAVSQSDARPAASTEPPRAAEPAKPVEPPKPVEPAAPSEPPRAAESPKPAEASKPAPAPVIDTPPKAAAPAAPRDNRPAAPVYSFKVPQTIPPEGAPYTVRWGDTLWDISEAFYRNPWLYTRIVRHNQIPNKNLIVAGTQIRVPPRN